ncbi:MAG: TolC family protein [Chthoniobacterales bacterium]
MSRTCLVLTVAVIFSIAQSGRALEVTLSEALARTVEKNFVIQQARSGLEAAAGRRIVLRANALPDARIGVAIGLQGGQRAGQDPITPFGFARGGFAQPLFDAAIPASRRRGNVEVLIAQQRLNMAIVSEVHATRTAFYSALYYRSIERLRSAQRAKLSRNVAAQTSRYEAGNAPHPIVAAATLLEQELAPRIEEAHRGYGAAIVELARASGSELGPEEKLATPAGDLRFGSLHLDLARETAAAKRDRPDLKLARLLVLASAEDQRIIEAAYYPEVNAVVSGDYIPVSGIRRGSEGSPRRSDDIISSEIRAGAAYTWRVVDNGKTGGAVLRQRSAREINELLSQKLEANVPRELERLYNNLAALTARHRSLEDAARAAEASTAAVNRNVGNGVLSQLDFRTSEASLLEAQSGLEDAAYQQSLALAEWDRATGRYFQFTDQRGAEAR